MTLGLANLKKLGTQILQAGVDKLKTVIGNALTPKVKFKLGNEEHRLWVAKGQNRNVVMMASEEKPLDDHIQAGKVLNYWEIISDQKKAEDPKNEEKAEPHVRELAGTIQSVTSGETVKVGNDGGDKGKDKEAENSKDVDPEEKQNGKAADKGTRNIPQGLTSEQFSNASKLIRQKVGDISDDIVVQGSRAGVTAKATSDIDFAIRVSPEQFDDLVKQKFGTPNVGSAKERTMLNAIKTGKIQSGEAGLRGLRKQLQEMVLMLIFQL